MTVLVIAPHPDDEAIGCGGAICQHTDAGARVAGVFLTSGELGLKDLDRATAWKTREAEAAAAAKILGVAEFYFLRQPDWTLCDAIDAAVAALLPVLKREQPQIIYVPHPADWHPDHKAANTVLTNALALSGLRLDEIRGYEVWTPVASYDVVIDISKVMDRKLAAIRAHASQLREIDYAHAARGLNAYRGAIASRTAYAEVFQLLHVAPGPNQ